MQVFDAIEGDADEVHTLMHATLNGYRHGRSWRLSELPNYTAPEVAADASLPEDLKQVAEEFAEQKCPEGRQCSGLRDNSCPLWHDGRELRFAKVCAALSAGAAHFTVSS